ncbi:zinc ribbon domain-containing protein [Oscillatoria salina]|uniref:zinc ribbon domain-containing protein n=1 Tax=Oscillatoria salina TaxID=331517 RepID=UPI0013BDBE08|nr:transposase [Oscillatoria salina IIICB1]NET87981.1 transposase [Kamptonema sp. SIO1D9]
MGKKFRKIIVALPPHYISQNYPKCRKSTAKSLSNRTHNFSCGFDEDRDVVASTSVLQKGLRIVGQTKKTIDEMENA